MRFACIVLASLLAACQGFVPSVQGHHSQRLIPMAATPKSNPTSLVNLLSMSPLGSGPKAQNFEGRTVATSRFASKKKVAPAKAAKSEPEVAPAKSSNPGKAL